MPLHQQHEETVLSDDPPGEIEHILHRAGIVGGVAVALDGNEVGAIGQHRIRLAAKLDVLVRRIRPAGWVEENLVDEQPAVRRRRTRQEHHHAQTTQERFELHDAAVEHKFSIRWNDRDCMR